MKYMGSKNRIAKYIVPILQECIDKNNIEIYVESCVGGANIIDKINCKTKIGTDNNPYLIALLKFARDNYNKENAFPLDIDKELYSKVRESYNKQTNEYSDYYKGLVGFLASRNGRFFDGGYATPLPTRNWYDEAKRNLLKQAPSLKGIKFATQDYLYYKDKNIRNCLFYLDPPYKDTKSYKFAKDFNHEEFWQFARDISKDNYVFISELEAPDDFECIYEQEIKRGIQKKKGVDKVKSVEKLFIYKFGKVQSVL